MGPLIQTPRGNVHLLVITDFFSKWVEVVPIPNREAQTVIDAFIREWVARYGMPASIQTDGAKEFQSHLMKDLAKLMELEKMGTLPYRAQSNGQVERFNRVLKDQLSCITEIANEDWDEAAVWVASSYRRTVQASTGCTPNMALFGEEIWSPPDLIFGVQDGGLDFPCMTSYIQHIKDQIRKAHAFMREKLGQAAVFQKRQFDKKANPRTYSPGEMVWRYYPPKANKKFGPKWDGPYPVIKQAGGTTYFLLTTAGVVKWHVDYLKPCYDENGLVKTINIHRAEEYQRLLRKGQDPLPVFSRREPEEGPGLNPRAPKNSKSKAPKHSKGGVPGKRRKNAKKKAYRKEQYKPPVDSGSSVVVERAAGKRKIKIPVRYGHAITAITTKLPHNENPHGSRDLTRSDG